MNKRKYETPDIAIIQSTTESSLLAGSVVTVTDVPITIQQQEDIALEDYQPFEPDEEFKELNF